MKRLMMAATFAALSLGAAQATVYGWTNWGATTEHLDGNPTHYDLSLGSITQTSDNVGSGATGGTLSGAYAVTNLAFAIYGVSDWWNDSTSTFDAIGLVVADAEGKVVAVSSATEYQMTNGTGNVYFPGAGDTKGMLSFDVNFLVDASKTFQVYFVTSTSPDVAVGSDASSLENIYSADDRLLLTAATDGSLVYRVSATVIPEPTALALLALGVAGVALRRRVA